MLAGMWAELGVKQIVTMMPNLLQGLFTAGEIDNIDHNTSSTTATGSRISLFQHPNEHSGGVDRREHRILARERTSKESFHSRTRM